ncbi:Site-specific DNA recombinase [Pseudomonas sp. NFPP33]|nr:recombinase family protein [Pseudomonas sp. NFPP33]SDA83214.1 Site-specific DNA recombinase [Pseudomonas sp. NFPP33]
MTKQAVPYIRFSSFRQTEGDSYRRQAELIDRWLTQHPEYTRSNLTFEDLAKSGFSTDAGKAASGFIKIREAIEAGLIRAGDCVLLEAIDRATRRGALDAFDLLAPILRAGVSIVTIDDGTEYTEQSLNGTQIFLLVAKLQAAHGYSKTLSERVSASYEARRTRAKGGEKIKRHTPVWLDSEGNIIQEVANQIRLVFEWYISGVGKHSIAARVRESGVSQLAKCSGPTVQGWLTNHAAIGAWANSDSTGDSIHGVYPAIVEPEKFHLVQKLLEERKTERKRTSKHFLVGLVKCAHCEASMVFHSVKGVPSAMRCLTHHRLKTAGCTNNKSIPVNIIKLVQVLTSYRAFKRALAKQTLSNSDKRRISLEVEIAQATTEINKLVALALSVDIQEVQEKLIARTADRQALEAELASLNTGDTVASESLTVLREESTLMHSDPMVLNAMLKDVGYAIKCDRGGRITTSEGREQWEYLGVKRKAKSNSTEAYRLFERPYTIIMVNPDPSIEVPAIHTSDLLSEEETDIRYQRYSGLVLSALNGGGEEEHLDTPYVKISAPYVHKETKDQTNCPLKEEH